MAINEFLGLNFRHINRDDIPYDWQNLEEGDIIENINNIKLIYKQQWKQYQLITNCPDTFLSKDDVYSNWFKI